MKLFTTSMMCVDMFLLGEQFNTIDKYSDIYHIDVMDGHFVPNISLSFDFIKQLRNRTKKPIDVHLMVENPGDFVDLLIDMKVDYIAFHPSTITKDVFRLINKVKSADIKFGIVLSPSADFEEIKYYKQHIDKLTIMTVEPGFAGQGAIKEAIDKIKEAKEYRTKHKLDFLIEVDGSNNFSTFETYNKFGTDVFVLGSTLFKEKNLEASYLKIKRFVEDLQ